MNGLELSRAFWNEKKGELFAGDLAELAGRAAAGLVGEGSECWGFDDEVSRDHDWGPGCCIWLTREDYAVYGEELQKRYASAASEPFCGFAPRPALPPGVPGRRVGVFRAEAFYVQFLPQGMPSTLEEWLAAPEISLAAVTNGEVFEDGAGRFTEIRNRILGYYPEDVRLRRIVTGCAVAAQAGQYNFPRQAARGEDLAALSALARFSEAATRVVFALARRYRPFYKWAPRAMLGLGGTGVVVHGQLEQALKAWRGGNAQAATEAVERACITITQALRQEGLSGSDDPWLLSQAEQVNARIQDDRIRSMNIMEE